jgi:FKBP-type peptidyl-prolyl cis-trans isomerase
MKLIYTLPLAISLIVFSCDFGNKPHKKVTAPQAKNTDKKKNKKSEVDTSFTAAKTNLKDFEKGKIEKTKTLDNGILIKWLVEGNGQKIKKGDMVLMEYRLSLPDGKIVDGNNKLNLPAIPFIVGYNMQTQGWDASFEHLNIGDFVKVEIPSELAFGKKGINGVIPADSPNWLFAKLYAVVAPGMKDNGITSWKIKDADKGSEQAIPDKEISFHAIVSTESKASVMNTYMSNFPIKYIPGQKSIVPGLRKILKNAKKGERYLVLLESPQAYGSRGYANLIKPNETVLFNIEIVDVRAI